MNDKIIEVLNSKMNTVMRNTYWILSFILLLGAANVSAQQYGKTYNPSHSQAAVGNRVNGQQQDAYNPPSASFFSTSTMPINKYGAPTPLSTVGAAYAPQLSTTTSSKPVTPRKIIGGGSEDDDEEGEGGGQTGGDNGKPENQDDPYASPLNDALFALLLMAIVYSLLKICVYRKTK